MSCNSYTSVCIVVRRGGLGSDRMKGADGTIIPCNAKTFNCRVDCWFRAWRGDWQAKQFVHQILEIFNILCIQ